MGLFDVHAHLTHPRLLEGIGPILERARSAGVSTIVTNGLNPDDNRQALSLAAEHPDLVRAAIGYYPVDVVLKEMREAGEEYPGEQPVWPTEEGVRFVREHADRAFAIGEIGLDGYWVPERFWEAQDRAFVQLLRVAQEVNKPVIIHTRKREKRALELLDEVGQQKVNWHCFGSRVKLARAIAERGHYLSIPANARRSESFTRMLQTLPRTQLLLETDCPYLGPDRDGTNEPSNVSLTLSYAAELWGESEAFVAQQLEENFERLFGVAP